MGTKNGIAIYGEGGIPESTTLNIKSIFATMSMSIENKSVDIQDSKENVRYCVECGAKITKSQKVCPACGESQ